MFFDSVKEINRLTKKINRLLSKRMSNIYLKINIKTFSKLWFSGSKKFITRSIFGELQLTQMSLNFITSCCNLKIRGLGAKRCVDFLLFYWKELWSFKVKESMHTAHKMKFSIKDFFSECGQTCSFLQIWSHVLTKFLMENFIFCVVAFCRTKI